MLYRSSSKHSTPNTSAMTETPRQTRSQRHRDPKTPTSTPSVKRLNGIYKDDRWWCNCEPNRKPAAIREVKKDTPNKGKLFYGCANPPAHNCGFFLWYDEAKFRETGLNSSVVEDDPRPKTPVLTQRSLASYGIQVSPGKRRLSRGEVSETDLDESLYEEAREAAEGSSRGYPTSSEMSSTMRNATQTPRSAKRKRILADSGDESDEFGDLAVDSSDEQELAALADESARKAQRTTYVEPVTPAMGSRTVHGLQTPSTSHTARTLFPSDRARRKSVSFEDTPTTHTLDTPSSVASSQTQQASPSDFTDVTSEIMTILQAQKVDQDTQTRIKRILTTAGNRAKGLEKGRDAARDVAKRQSEKVAKLQERLAMMEDRVKVSNEEITKMKDKLMRIYQDH